MKKKTGLMTVLSVLFALLILVGAGMICVSAFVVKDLTTTRIAQDHESLGITENQQRGEGVVNLALFGVDSRTDPDGDKALVGCSDAIMVISVDTAHDKIKLTSLLRDSRVYLGEETPNEDGYDKLNHAYAYGGPQFAIRTLNQTYGLNIEDYVSVNLAGMAEIIDALGGVDVEITEAEIEQINNNIAGLYDENPDLPDPQEHYYNGEAGSAHLTGVQAAAYGQIRNMDADAMRAVRQQEIFPALLGKALSLSRTESPAVLTKLLPWMETSLSIGEIINLAGILTEECSIERLVIPGEAIPCETGIYEGDTWMWTYDLELAADAINSFIYGAEMTPVSPVTEEKSREDEAAKEVTAEISEAEDSLKDGAE